MGSQFVGSFPRPSNRKWTLIFPIVLYTGGSRVATIVLTAAAKTLSPVTTEVCRGIHSLNQSSNNSRCLQLGGKSPVVIDPKCDLKLTARRLMWGKVANAGQVHPLVLMLLMSPYISSRPALHQIMPWSQRVSWIRLFENVKKCKHSSSLR